MAKIWRDESGLVARKVKSGKGVFNKRAALSQPLELSHHRPLNRVRHDDGSRNDEEVRKQCHPTKKMEKESLKVRGVTNRAQGNDTGVASGT